MCCCAADGKYLNYYHSRTPFYDDLFFTWWNDCFCSSTCALLDCYDHTTAATLGEAVKAVSLPGPFSRSRLDGNKAARV